VSDLNKKPLPAGGILAGMKVIDKERLDRAEQSIWRSARLLERLRFQQLFRAASAAPVIAALRAYQTPDGGFGHAIEPDFRGPISQPLTVDFGLRVLAECPEPDRAVLHDALKYVKSITLADGGVPNTLPTVRPFPRAPWWEPAGDKPPSSLLPTAGLVGLLYAFQVDDPWLDAATKFCWSELDRLLERAATAKERLPRLFVVYESRAALGFLDSVPDRARAERIGADLGKALWAAKLIQVEPDPAAHTAQPLELASTPAALAARWFEPKLVDAHLDAFVEAQRDHGGWDVAWELFTPAAEHEWRGIQTIERLKTLRAWNRVDG
jgi:hypothetical protein